VVGVCLPHITLHKPGEVAGTRTTPSKWKVRKLIPIRSWHSVGASGSEFIMDRMRGNMLSIIAIPSAAAAIRESVCWVAASGGGVQACDSHNPQRPELRIAGHQLAQGGGAGARQPDDEHRSADDLVVDLRVLLVGVLDPQPLDQALLMVAC